MEFIYNLLFDIIGFLNWLEVAAIDLLYFYITFRAYRHYRQEMIDPSFSSRVHTRRESFNKAIKWPFTVWKDIRANFEF